MVTHQNNDRLHRMPVARSRAVALGVAMGAVCGVVLGAVDVDLGRLQDLRFTGTGVDRWSYFDTGASPADGLQLWYRFPTNEATTIIDESGKGNNGTPYSGLWRSSSNTVAAYWQATGTVSRITSTVAGPKALYAAWVATNGCWRNYAVMDGVQYVNGLPTAFNTPWQTNGDDIAWLTNMSANVPAFLATNEAARIDENIVRSDTTNVLALYLATAAEHGTSPWYTNAYGGTLWSNLVGSWNFEAYYPSKGCVQDESTNFFSGTNGTGAGAAAFLTDYTNGFTNGFVRTDGGDSIDFGDIESLAYSTALTVRVWFKTIAQGGNLDSIVGKSGSVNNDGEFILARSVGTTGSNLLFGVSLTNNLANYINTGGNTLQNGQWNHIVGTYVVSERFPRLYVNGSLVTTLQTSNGLAVANGANAITNSAYSLRMFIGASGLGAQNGDSLDDLMVLKNYAFTPTDATNDFNATKEKFGYAP